MNRKQTSYEPEKSNKKPKPMTAHMARSFLSNSFAKALGDPDTTVISEDSVMSEVEEVSDKFAYPDLNNLDISEWEPSNFEEDEYILEDDIENSDTSDYEEDVDVFNNGR